MSLSKVLEEIKRVQPHAEEDVTTGPPETLAGRRGRKAQAIETLKRLKREYSNSLRETAAYILVVGDKRDAFASIATENYKCFSNDPESFFTDLVNRVPAALYINKDGESNMFDIVGRHLEDKALELDLVGYPQLIFRHEYQRHLTSKEDFLALIKLAVTEQVGGELVGIQAAKELTDAAIKRDHGAKLTPILLPTGDDKFALTVARDLERLSNRVFIVSVGKSSKAIKAADGVIFVKDPTNENVENALKTISASLKRGE